MVFETIMSWKQLFLNNIEIYQLMVCHYRWSVRWYFFNIVIMSENVGIMCGILFLVSVSVFCF